MEILTPLRQPHQGVSLTEATEVPETNFNQRDIFKLFRRLELLSQRQGIVSEVILSPVAETWGQRFKVVIRPVSGKAEEIRTLEKGRPRFESEVEIALHSNFCPVITIFDLHYPAEWLRSVLPHLSSVPELRTRVFPFNDANPVDENTFIETADSFFPYYHFEFDTGYLDLDACTNEYIFENVFSAFERQLLQVLAEYWRDGVVGMTEEQALRWQCRQISPLGGDIVDTTRTTLYRCQAHWLCGTSVTAFLLDRLAGLPYLLRVGGNLVARHAAAVILNQHQGETVFYRDTVAVILRDWRDYELISQIRQTARAARGTARVVQGILPAEPGRDRVSYFVLDSGQEAVTSEFTPLIS